MTEQDQIMLTHEPGTLDLASMTAVDLIKMGASAKANEDRETAQLVTKELQKRYHAGTLNAEYNDPAAGRIIAEQRNQIAELNAKIALLEGELLGCRASHEDANAELHDLRIKVGLLQPEPDWSQAPPGFDCWAMDKNYDPYFYRGEPRLSVKNGEWMINTDEGAALFDYSCSFPGWAESLRERPK